jgi:hypothetical protein
MDNFSFKEFYENQRDYAGFRNDAGKRSEYEAAAGWKTRNLSRLVSGDKQYSSILEIGCAMGILLNNLADRLSIKERTGADISSANIESAMKMFPGCTFIRGTVDDILMSGNGSREGMKYDLVLLSDIVEHVPDDLDFMRKVSGISDSLLLNLPLEKCYSNMRREYGVTDPSGHLRKYNLDDAFTLIRSAGLEVIKWHTANARYDGKLFELHRRARDKRIMIKRLPRRLFWKGFYCIEDTLKVMAPAIYTRLFGSNLFALLRPVRK